MRIGILSDTHDQLARTREAVRLLRAEGAETLFHCGDIIEPSVLEVCADLPCYFVFGNHDADVAADLRRAALETGVICLGWADSVSLSGKRVAVTHGHMRTDVRRLLADEPDYLLTGHSHIAADRHEGTTRRLNPGALHEADAYTVALLDVLRDEVRLLELAR